MEYKSLRMETSGGVATVTLQGPGKGNALGPDFFREMPVAFSELDRSDEVKCILLCGQGESFSYGLDLPAVMGDLGPLITGPKLAADRTKLLALIRDFQKACTVVEHCRKPVIAAIHGYCIGGGLDLVAACDIRLCSADAVFSLREVKVAMVADLGVLQRLPLIIGQGATRELAFTGKDIKASRAASLGLVSQVCETKESLLAEAQQMAEQITTNAPLAVQGIKEVMRYCEGKPISEGLDYVAVWNAAFLQSMDLAEAFTAFREKRPPKFRGR